MCVQIQEETRMKPFDFGDLYKFSVSLGLGLIISACALPWLMVRDNPNLRLSKTEIKKLPDTAQKIITTRQNYTKILITLTPVISPLFIVFGIYLIGYGVQNWKKRQSLDDEKLKREVGPDAAISLISHFLDQFRKLSETQVSRFFMFLRLESNNHAFEIPDMKQEDPNRENEIHEDLRGLREAFLLIAQDRNSDRFSGRFQHPRIVVSRPWAKKIGSYVAEESAQELKTVDGESWHNIRSRVYNQKISEIEEELKEAFKQSPKDTK